MKPAPEPNPKPVNGFRQLAEERARQDAARAPEFPADLTSEGMGRTLHELHVHQIELEMQNEELQNTQAALDELWARYFDLYDLAPVGYVTVGENGVVLEGNLTAATLLGVSRGELAGRSTLESFIFQDDREVFYQTQRRLHQAGSTQECELRLVRHDGAVFWAQLEVVLAQPAGEEAVLRVVMTDINGRRQLEESRQDAEWKFRALFEHGPIGVAYHKMIYDAAGTPADYLFLDVNETYRELTGVDPRGLTVKQAFPGIEHDAFDWIGTFGRVARSGEPVRFESYLEFNDRWYDCVGYQYQPDHFVVAFINITERKRAEQKLSQSLREKESLLQEIHHRVKNNLQIISSLLRLQSGHIDHQETKAVLQDMQSRIRSMALIHEHLYRSENLSAVDLAAYLKTLCLQLRQALVATPDTIEIHLELAPVQLGIDQAIPCGLLVNELVSNALKHAFPDGRRGELRVELRPSGEGPGWWLRVADNGVGLPPGFALDQLDSLGLKLVTDLTRQLGGRLEIGPGPGAAFEVLSGA